MPQGKVKWFNDVRGYGFITSQDGEEVFVLRHDIQAEGYKTLFDDEPVEFEAVETERCPRAVNVVPLEG